MRCEHEVPCTCPEFLNRLSKKQLENLRVQFGKVVVDSRFQDRLSLWLDKRQARRMAAKVNHVLGEKFRIIIV